MKINYLSILFVIIVSFNCKLSHAQDKNIIEIADKACECTKDISVNFIKDTIIKKINDCIIIKIAEKGTDDVISEMKKTADSLLNLAGTKDTTITAYENGKNYTIIVDKDFEKIQQYMHYNCRYVKELMAVDNIEHNYSLSKNQKALDLYYEGIYLSEDEKYQAAIEKYKQALKIDDKFSFAWDNMGLCYRKVNDYKQAINCYEKSVKLDPKAKTPLKNMAVAYSLMGNQKKASEQYEKFVSFYPNDPEGYYGAARSYYNSGNYKKGVDYIFKAYKIYVNEKSPYINDAQEVMVFFCNDLKEKNKLDIFLKAAKDNNVDITE